MRRLILALGLSGALGCPGPKPAAAPPRHPMRIVSQTVTSDEILWELGPPVHARVAGVSRMADDERYSGVPHAWPEAVPRIAGASEALLAATPDLVLIADFTAAETRAALTNAGIPLVVLSGFRGFDDYRDRVREVAKLVDATEAGEVVVGRFDAELAQLRAPAPLGNTVLSYIAGYVGGSQTTFDDSVRTIGCRNLAAENDVVGHAAVGLEQVVAWDPQVLVVECDRADCGAVEREVAAQPGLSATRAARTGRVIAIESSILFSTGRGMLGVARRLRERLEPRP